MSRSTSPNPSPDSPADDLPGRAGAPSGAGPLAEDALLDRLLAAERFHVCPQELLARIVAEHVGATWSRARRVAAFAAAVVLAVGAIAALTGQPPSPSSTLWAVKAAPPPVLGGGPLGSEALGSGALGLPSLGLPAAALPWLGVAGALLVLGGVLLARRWSVRSSSPREDTLQEDIA